MELENIKVLLIEDDTRLQSLICRMLTEHGFRVFASNDFENFQKQTLRHPFNLYLLDINLPGKNGLEICQYIRDSGDETPIIMISARGDDSRERILGLELGADDYLAKPFDPNELLARIFTLLKRVSKSSNHCNNDRLVFEFDCFFLDWQAKDLLFLGRKVELTLNELTVLKILIQNKTVPVSRTQLSFRIYGREHSPDQREIDMTISRLRRQLSFLSPKKYILTVRGIGYMFVS